MRSHPDARHLAPLAAGALLALGLAGCVVAPPHGAVVYDNGGYASAEIYAPSAPPAPYVEVQPALPFPGAIWIGGYWNWSGGRHVWTPGHYERPHPGYRWAPHRWEPGPRGGWYLRGGGWIR